MLRSVWLIMDKVIIYVSEKSKRLEYICKIIFTDFIGVDYKMVTELTDHHGAILINYSDKQIPSSFKVPCDGLLESHTIDDIEVKVSHVPPLPVISFPLKANNSSSKQDIAQDIFSLAFFYLTRYEEYRDYPKDQHGRFQSKYSLSINQHIAHLPIVDLWIQHFCALVNDQYSTSWKLKPYRSPSMTLDIDQPYAFKHKGIRKYLGALRDIGKLDLATLSTRMKEIVLGQDPFDTYEYLESQMAKYDCRPHIFILNKYNPPLDLNHLAGKKELGLIIDRMSSWAELGIHPSLSAGQHSTHIKQEIESLRQLTSSDSIRCSRQHYLKIDLPHTYRALEECDITDDYSMGYPDQVGFRAGTARAYRWYDLKEERESKLNIHPMMVMDVTLRYYLGLSPDQAIELYDEILQNCLNVSATCISLWHNSNLSKAYGWQPWKRVFEHMLATK